MTQENNESFCKILFFKQQANTHLCEERKNSLSVCCLYLVSMLHHLSSLHHWERETSFNPFADLWCDELFCVVYEGLNESVVCTGRRAGQATWTRRLCDQGWKTVVTLTALAESMPTLSALVLSTLDVVTWTFFLFYLNIFDLLWKKVSVMISVHLSGWPVVCGRTWFCEVCVFCFECKSSDHFCWCQCSCFYPCSLIVFIFFHFSVFYINSIFSFIIIKYQIHIPCWK